MNKHHTKTWPIPESVKRERLKQGLDPLLGTPISEEERAETERLRQELRRKLEAAETPKAKSSRNRKSA